MKKIGLISLALVLAVGGLGIGYAAWTDTITIDGTVNTGSVDLEIIKLSSTYVYKDLNDDSMIVRYVVTDADTGSLIHESVAIPSGAEGTDYLVVASAVATADLANDSVTFTYVNVFPSVDFICDVLLHYNGSVPVKVNAIDWVINSESPTDWFTDLLALALVPGSTEGAVGYARMFNDHTIGAVVDVGTQLEYCDLVKIWFIMHLPQDAPMGASASVTATIDVVQWNEYPYNP